MTDLILLLRFLALSDLNKRSDLSIIFILLILKNISNKRFIFETHALQLYMFSLMTNQIIVPHHQF